MATVGGMSTSQRLRAAATPEKANLAGSLKISSLAILVLSFVVMILLLATVIFNQYKKTTTETDKEKKQKVINGMVISSLVASVITAFVGLWVFMIAAKSVKELVQ